MYVCMYVFTRIDWSSAKEPPESPLPIFQNISINPPLSVFAAGDGDNTLFHWLHFNMLVDGD